MPTTLDKFIVGKEEFIQQEQAIKEAILSLRPSTYLKSIVKTESSRLIEITDETGNLVSFQYGFTSPTWDIITGDPSTNTDFVTWLNTNYINTNKLGVANGVATLDANGHVPTAQIAGSVAEVMEGYYFNNEFYQDAAHTTLLTHNVNGIYYDLGNSYKQYRWTGSAYIAVTSTVTLNTARDDSSSTSAYRADFGASNYADITALQSGKQSLLSSTNKLNPAFVATDASNRFVADSDISAWNAKQGALTFDNEPTDNSDNPVKSKGIKSYVDTKVIGSILFKGTVATYADLPTLITTPQMESGWEYCVTNDEETGSENALYAAVVTGTVPSRTLSWNFMGNTTSLANYIPKAEKGVANGVATLDASALIKEEQLPDWLKKSQLYGGVVNKVDTKIIVTMTATLKDKLNITDATIEVVNLATDDKTQIPKQIGYKTLEGTYFNVGNEFSFASLDFKVGDLLVGLGTSWDKIDHTTDLSGKVDKVSTAQQAYATNADGGQTSIFYTSLANGQTIMYRDASGRASVDEPTTDNEIVNLKFLGKISTVSTTAPTETTVGEKGELILYKPSGTEDKAKLYQLARITVDATSVTTYEWEEITNQLEDIDESSILRGINGLKVSYGGSYKENKNYIIKNGFTSAATSDANLIKITSSGTAEITHASEGDNLSVSFNYVGTPYELHGTIDSMTITGDDTATEYEGIGILLVENVTTGVNLYYFQYNDEAFLALTTGDMATVATDINELNVAVVDITTTTIRPEVVPYSTTYFSLEAPDNLIIPLYDDTVTSASDKAPKSAAVYNFVTQNYMPLSGGTFTGDVMFAKTKVIKSAATDATGSIAIYGDNAVAIGGALSVYGFNNVNNKGGFNLRVANGNNSYFLEGTQEFDTSTSTWTPHLKWNNNEVITKVNILEDYINGNPLIKVGKTKAAEQIIAAGNDKQQRVTILGGDSWTTGGMIALCGENSTFTKGAVDIRAYDHLGGTSETDERKSQVLLFPNGTFQQDGNNILVEKSVTLTATMNSGYTLGSNSYVKQLTTKMYMIHLEIDNSTARTGGYVLRPITQMKFNGNTIGLTRQAITWTDKDADQNAMCGSALVFGDGYVSCYSENTINLAASRTIVVQGIIYIN